MRYSFLEPHASHYYPLPIQLTACITRSTVSLNARSNNKWKELLLKCSVPYIYLITSKAFCTLLATDPSISPPALVSSLGSRMCNQSPRSVLCRYTSSIRVSKNTVNTCRLEITNFYKNTRNTQAVLYTATTSCHQRTVQICCRGEGQNVFQATQEIVRLFHFL